MGRTQGQELVRLDIEAGVATITLDSPHNRNALSAQLRCELLGHVETAVAEDAVRAIVLTHAGGVFCAGADLKEARAGANADPGAEFTAVLERLWCAPKPVVARLAGPARAGGIGLVAACDFAVAAEPVTFAFTEVRIGVIPAVISAPLRHRVAPTALHRLFLTGETFDSRRAAEIGLLSSVVAADRLDDEVRELIDRLLLGAPKAMSGTKRLVREPSLQPELDRLQELSARYFSSPEGQEGMRAFAERRRPAWVDERN